MRHERILNRPDGSRVRINVTLSVEWNRDEVRWDFSVYHCAPRKRTWTTPVNHDDYSWRDLDREQRRAEDKRRCLTLASESEVLETMNELLQSIKPVIK